MTRRSTSPTRPASHRMRRTRALRTTRARRATRAGRADVRNSSLLTLLGLLSGATAPCLGDAAGDVRTQYRPDQECPGDDLDPVRRDGLAEQDRLLDAPEQEQRQDDPDDRAATAEDRDAAQQHGGDGGELEALPDVRRGGRVAQRDHDPG